MTEPHITVSTEGLSMETVVKKLKLSRFATDISLRILLVQIQGVPGGMCQTSGGCSLC